MTIENRIASPAPGRRSTFLLLALLLGAAIAGPASAANPPGTPAPDPRPAPAPIGASGNGRWQFGSATGLYVVDPGVGEIALQGATPGSIPLVSVSLNKGAPPADTTITLNGVKLIRWSGNPQLQWTLDPAGPQPTLGAGGYIDLVASDGSGRQREMVLPCPSDVAMISSPLIGSSLASDSPIDITFAKTVVLNPAGIPGLAGIFPEATLVGYNTTTGRLVPGSLGHALIGAGQLGVTVPVLGRTSAPAYLMDVRWPGPWQIDGETGAFCGLAKRWTYRNDTAADPAPILAGVSPSSGPAAGGETVTIDGASLASVTSVTFDGAAATIVALTDASITVTTPAHTPGTVAILLSSPGGIATSTYTYIAPEPTLRHRAARH
jgi:IPT/TIG domain